MHNKFAPIFPIHIQLNPTNLCQLNCSFCSCKERNRELQLTINEIKEIMMKAKKLGVESCTITGGGEPLLHKDINEIFSLLHRLNIEVGLVTNGLLLSHIEKKYSKNIVWCRISSSDELPKQLERIGKTRKEWFEIIDKACNEYSHIDWAFSHVKSYKGGNLGFLRQLIDFANKHNFTHVRLVSNIFKAFDLEFTKSYLAQILDINKVIFQARKEYTYGSNPCFISLLKPVIGADSYIYPCCGVQYALASPSRDYEKSMRMEKAINLDQLVEKQAFFNGSVCQKCFYHNYNWALGILLSNLKHERFV